MFENTGYWTTNSLCQIYGVEFIYNQLAGLADLFCDINYF